jgi:hypothetical protein
MQAVAEVQLSLLVELLELVDQAGEEMELGHLNQMVETAQQILDLAAVVEEIQIGMVVMVVLV